MNPLASSLLISLVVAAAVTDLRSRRIPNALTVGGLATALLLRALVDGAALADGLGGAGVALLLTVPFFAAGALGGGDVKLLAAVGAFTGLDGLLVTLLATAIMGGVMGVAEAVRKGVALPVLVNAGRLLVYCVSLGQVGNRAEIMRAGTIYIPYALAIAAGTVVGRLL